LIVVEDSVGKKRAADARDKELSEKLDKCQEDLVDVMANLTRLVRKAAENYDGWDDVREGLELIEMLQDLMGVGT
jgi:molecular chaperone GrpE (heat shock protein)